MERLMRGESDPYIVQNVRLTFGSLLFNCMFLFVMGWIGDAEQPPRSDLAFWNYRPTSEHCSWVGTCDASGVYIPSSPLATNTGSCSCGQGVFVGWTTDWYVYGAMLSGVVYNWVTGLVVKEFSSVYRSVADGIMLLVVYFLLTPLLDHTGLPFEDMAKTLVCLMVPISGTTFSYAAMEMQKVMASAEAEVSPVRAGAAKVLGQGLGSGPGRHSPPGTRAAWRCRTCLCPLYHAES